MYGDSAIKRKKYLRLVLRLEELNEDHLNNLDRLTGSHATTSKKLFVITDINNNRRPPSPQQEPMKNCYLLSVRN